MEENKEMLNSEEVQAMSREFVERLEKEDKSNEIYEELLISYGLAPIEKSSFVHEDGNTYPCYYVGEGKTVLKSEDYPDYYGGAYIDSKGELVINVYGNRLKINPLKKTIIISTILPV